VPPAAGITPVSRPGLTRERPASCFIAFLATPGGCFNPSRAAALPRCGGDFSATRFLWLFDIDKTSEKTFIFIPATKFFT
jgi:hypothetical protein